jgi:hypothetical protein
MRWTDPPTKDSYQMSVDREVRKEGQGPIRTVEASCCISCFIKIYNAVQKIYVKRHLAS